MRRHARKGHILQKHEDLRREYERLLRVYEREEKYVTSRFALTQSEYLDKMNALESLDGKSPSLHKAVGSERETRNEKLPHKHHIVVSAPKLQRPKQNILLFRIEQREGQNVYVKTTDSQK
ncbi:hypothetical protein Bpfe_015161 [Biomphalaria pfeifferi]|uniref:Uncharacterized protein n=1 Tax=Biomphalaria pfeifferi TaxID=112525 RepID=A0AAD8F9L1_BIOPF|nr:hypothetical protein Bpfe_015161 [Biomphalaria pfeifferi]